MTFPIEELVIEALNEKHSASVLGCFTCGTSSELDNFVKNDALYEQNRRLNRTFLFFHKNNLVGYVSLNSDLTNAVYFRKTDLVQKGGSDRPIYKSFPCVLIGRLAVQEEYRRKGIGEFIVARAIGIILESVSKYIGVRFVTVDPKDEISRNFYKNKCGFVDMYIVRADEATAPRMYINLEKICERMRSNESLDKWAEQ
jgi:hypothetical protein